MRRNGQWGGTLPDFKPDSMLLDHMGPFIMNPEGAGSSFGPLARMPTAPSPKLRADQSPDRESLTRDQSQIRTENKDRLDKFRDGRPGNTM